jgi:hypothetical protein
MSLFPMRCFLYVKEHFDYEKYEDAFGDLWKFYWVKHRDVSKPEVLGGLLGGYFGREEVAISTLSMNSHPAW